MRIQIQVIIEADHEATPARVEEVACFERGSLSPETLGLQLNEAKQLLAGIQQIMTAQQVEEYVEQQRQCSHCQQPLACKGHHQIGLRTLFGKLTLESPRFYTCACQPHQKRSWSPVAALFSERSTPELLCQEVRWASLLSYGVTVKLLGDLLPMDHQLSTSTISRHVHQVAERLEGELGDEQPSFIEGCPSAVPLSELSITERLEDIPRPGKPPGITAEQRCQIVALACEAPSERPISHWTAKEIAQEIMQRGIVEQISPRHAARLLKKGISNPI